MWPSTYGGKTSRRTGDKRKGLKSLHRLSAYATNARLTLAQRSILEKTNEITAIPELLDHLVETHQLKGALQLGCVFTDGDSGRLFQVCSPSWHKASMWRATVLTLFPEMFPGPLGLSLAGDALSRGVWELEPRQIREHGLGRHRAVDDTPAGGGPGMVMRADVICAAIDAALTPEDARPRLLMSPRGAPLTQRRVRALANGPGAIILCARFEGVDERIISARALEEISIGDYILSGGEIAALALMDACIRLLPGVMGEAASGTEESFEGGLLEYPHYTRPRMFEGLEIPEILLSGDHKKIARWRREQALRLTRERRPDLVGELRGGTGNID